MSLQSGGGGLLLFLHFVLRSGSRRGSFGKFSMEKHLDTISVQREVFINDFETGARVLRVVPALITGEVRSSSRRNDPELVDAELEGSYLPATQEQQALYMEDLQKWGKAYQKMYENDNPVVKDKQPIVDDTPVNMKRFPSIFGHMDKKYAIELAKSVLSESVIRVLKPQCNVNYSIRAAAERLTMTKLKQFMAQCGANFVRSEAQYELFRFEHTDVYDKASELEEFAVCIEIKVTKEQYDLNKSVMERQLVIGMPLNNGDKDYPLKNIEDDFMACRVEDFWFTLHNKMNFIKWLNDHCHVYVYQEISELNLDILLHH